MKKLLIIILIFKTFAGLSQEGNLNLVYTQTITDNTGKESLNKRGEFTKVFSQSIIHYLESHSNLTQQYFLHKDSIFCQTIMKGDESILNTKMQYGDEVYIMNNLTGERLKYKLMERYIKPLRERLKKRKRSEKVFLGYECEKYTAKEGDKKLLMYVTKDSLVAGVGRLYDRFSYRNGLIMYSELEDEKTGERVVYQLQSIDSNKEKFELLQKELVKLTQQLNMNTHITVEKVELGEVVPNIYYQDVLSASYKSLHDYKGTGKYLLIDFWGTWCKPCIASIPDLKLFYEQHKGKLDVLSMDYKDSNMATVKKMITITKMTWAQGIATEQINMLLNPAVNFPGIVLLDDEMRVILRMNAKEGLEKVAGLIK